MIPILSKTTWRTLAPGQISRIQAVDATTGVTRTLHESSSMAFESPNWTPDGRWLIVNAAGALYRLPASGGEPEPIETGWLDDHNNDHLVSRDGATIYTSSETTGHLFAVSIDGGAPVRVSPDREGVFGYFLQGESPDGRTLAFTGAERRDGEEFVSGLFLLDLQTQRVTRVSGWTADAVGCDWSSDGGWLYFGSELGSTVRGHSQIHRMRPDGTGVTRLTDDARVNWFPKVSPSCERVVFLSFPTGTIGHASDVDVVIRSMAPDGSDQRDLIRMIGGQGTLNMNSWAPSSDRFACISYERGTA